MVSMGVRTCPNEVYLVIVDGTINEPALVYKRRLREPASRTVPQSLCWYREQVMAIAEEYGVQAIGIRTAEPMAASRGGNRASAAKRCNIEGVIMEAGASMDLAVIAGPLITISAGLGTKGAKKYIEAKEFRTIEGWQELDQKYQEAILAGAAALSEDDE